MKMDLSLVQEMKVEEPSVDEVKVGGNEVGVITCARCEGGVATS